MTSRKSSSLLPAVSGAWLDRPVTLPPGRARLATMPLPTGSPAVANTIGITDVACFAARAGGVLCVRITSTLSRTNSAAISAKRSLRPSAQRYSIATLRPSLQRSSRSRCTKAAVHWLCAAAVPEPMNPMVGSFAGCASAASGARMRLTARTTASPISLLRKSPVSRGSPLGSRFQNHTVPLAFEQLDRAACDPMSVAAVVVGGARFTVSRALGEEMIDRPKHRVGHGHHGFLVPAMPHHASVSGLQRTVLRASRRRGGFDEGHSQPPVAFPSLPGFVLPRALVVARTDPRPTGQMPVARETAHIHPELGDDHLGRPLIDPGDRVQLR